MIAPLRKRHRLMTLVLGIATFLLFLLGLSSRAPEPTVDELPPALEQEVGR